MRNKPNWHIVQRYQHRSWYLFVILIFICAAAIVFLTKPKVISPCASTGCTENTVYVKDATTDMQDIASETAFVFGKEGSGVLREAFDILNCEHGYQKGGKPHLNDNGSYDYGAFQINSVWEKVYGTKFETDYKENIRVAHEIWKKSHSFQDWVCERYI